MDVPWERAAAERVLDAERRYVLALGGYSLEVTGASLLVHERIPVPSFNRARVDGVGRERQTAFFERALDHYFQRALRPSFELPDPPPEHLVRGLTALGFRRVDPPRLLFEGRSAPSRDSGPGAEIEELGSSGIDRLLSFWAGPAEREEFARALRVLLDHPNPGERLHPLVAVRSSEDLAVGALYIDRDGASLQGVSTRPDRRREGQASALVARALAIASASSDRPVSMSAVGDAAVGLGPLGLVCVGALARFELPKDAELHVAPPGPPGPPRWRPPRPSG